MFRFTRTKRFFSAYSYDEFMEAARELAAAGKAENPAARVEIRATLDTQHPKYPAVSMVAGDEVDGMPRQTVFPLDEFTKAVWDRAIDVRLDVQAKPNGQPLMLSLAINVVSDPRRLRFYGQYVTQATVERILASFARPRWSVAVGSGY